MVQLNLALREINCKVVYFGCGLGGKTTNLEIVHEKAAPDSRGELTSIATESDRTLFFDFMPLDLGTVSGMRVKFQLYTVPGQVYYNSTRKLVLRGADGVIFVADSQRDKMDENIESLDNLADCLREQGRDLAEMPHVIQFNKRDLAEIMSVEEMKQVLNRHEAPCFEAIASKGDGVLETFKALAAMMLEKVKAMSTESSSKPGGRSQRLSGNASSQRITTDAQRLQGGIAATPVEPTPIAREAARPAPAAPPPRAAPAPRPPRPGAPAPRDAEIPAAIEPAARARPEGPAPESKATPPPAAVAAPERVRPSVRSRSDHKKGEREPAARRGSKTTSGVRVAGGGIMITTSARRRKESAPVGLVIAIIAILGAGAAAAWHFLM